MGHWDFMSWTNFVGQTKVIELKHFCSSSIQFTLIERKSEYERGIEESALC